MSESTIPPQIDYNTYTVGSESIGSIQVNKVHSFKVLIGKTFHFILYVCMHVCVCVCMYVCMHACIYVCMYV